MFGVRVVPPPRHTEPVIPSQSCRASLADLAQPSAMCSYGCGRVRAKPLAKITELRYPEFHDVNHDTQAR